MIADLLHADVWVALISLIAMEIVLGIDNVVFISVLTSRLPASRRTSVARIGLGLALGMRIALLFALRWLAGLTDPLATILGRSLSARDLILIVGGLFLIAKATIEIHRKVEGEREADAEVRPKASSVGWVLAQIALLDVVFSLDSVITAIGMVSADRIWIMVVAIVVAVVVMLVFASPIGEVVQRHPTLKILALSFLVVIGVLLVADGLGRPIPKGYVYFSIAFALGVELVNIRFRSRNPKADVSKPERFGGRARARR